MKCYSLYDPNFKKQFIGNAVSSPQNYSQKMQRCNNFNNQNKFRDNPFRAFMTSMPQNNSNGWYPNTRASNHVTNNLANLSFNKNYNDEEQVHVLAMEQV